MIKQNFARNVVKLWIAITVLGLLLAIVGAAPSAAQGNGVWRCVEVNGDANLNVRAGASVNDSVIVSLAPGSRAEADYTRQVTSPNYNWVPVRFEMNGTLREGWAITPRLDACPPGVGADLDSGDSGSSIPGVTLPVADGGGIAGVNDDGVLDRDEIAIVARSVVLIGNVQRNRVVSAGTGTIASPDGLIITNAHVVEDADYATIGLLDNINDPPEFQYIADIIGYDEETDVALLQINADMRGNAVNTATLNLPYISATLHPDDVFRGDQVYIFGYPDIGDDYLVVTTGSIVSVENGNVQGERLPVWYRTDAELAPGNSGGLAVNGNGEFVGIPTFVRSEYETGGRLGGIRPAQVALMAVMDEAAAVLPPSDSGPSADPAPAALVDGYAATLDQITVSHNVTVGGEQGVEVHVALSLVGWANQNAQVYVRVYYDDLAAEPLRNPSAPLRYRDSNDQVSVSVPVQPCCDETVYDDLALFIPYEAFGLTRSGEYDLKLRVGVATSDGAWDRALSWEFMTLTVR